MTFIIIMAIYIVSSLFIAKMLFRTYNHRTDALLWKIGIAYMSPLLLLGWLQNQATKLLDIWFDM